jgi:hypothetical protein
MRGVAKQFAVVFFAGFMALALALACSSIVSGELMDSRPFLVALRAFGLGWMATGMVLWIALRREEGGKPEINLPLYLLSGSGSLLLLLALVMPLSAIMLYLVWAGVGLTLAALLIGAASMIFAPAYPKPITVRWPEGGEIQAAPPVPAADTHLPAEQAPPPDDLTKIAGIGPKAQKALNQAGITTFARLGECSSDGLKDALAATHVKTAIDLSSWPRQAALAACGDWNGLKALQESLRAGRSTR